MNFEQLLATIPDAKKEDWRQARGGGWIYKDAKASDESNINDNAIVLGDARVSGNARVYGDAWRVSPLFVIGSRFSLTNSKHGHITIGCECHTLDWWINHGLELAKAHDFTEQEIAEYTAYIELFKKIGK